MCKPAKYPGWRTMTAAQRYNAKAARIFETAKASAPPVLAGAHDRPCAARGLISYRYRGVWGWIMIGAHDHADAEREAARSTSYPIERSRLQVWDGAQYVPVTP